MNSDIKKIVVPIDFSVPSEAAARFACGLGRKRGAHLYLIHVIATPPLTHPDGSDAALRRELAGAELARLRQQLGAAQITIEVRTGGIEESITSAVVAYGADLIVMATHGRTGVPHLLFGSVAEQVIHVAPCPVLVVRDSGKIRVHNTAPKGVEERLATIA